MSLVAVAQQAGITPDARVLHQRPELIQELMWLPRGHIAVPGALHAYFAEQLHEVVAVSLPVLSWRT